MKRIFALLLSALFLTGCAAGEVEPTAPSEELLGGWTLALDQPAGELPPIVRSAFDAANESVEGYVLEPIAHLGTQVVAGANYALLCRAARPNGEQKLAVVIINDSPTGIASVLRVTELKVAEAAANEGTEALDGGWNVTEEPVSCLDEDTAAAFASLTLPEGISTTPIALLGTQVVAGLYRAVLCVQTENQSAPRLCVVVVYTDLSGNSEIVGIAGLSLEDYSA